MQPKMRVTSKKNYKTNFSQSCASQSSMIFHKENMIALLIIYVFTLGINVTETYELNELDDCKEHFRSCKCDKTTGIIYCDKLTTPEGLARLPQFVDYQLYKMVFIEMSNVRHLRPLNAFNGIIFVKRCILCLTTEATCLCVRGKFEQYIAVGNRGSTYFQLDPKVSNGEQTTVHGIIPPALESNIVMPTPMKKTTWISNIQHHYSANPANIGIAITSTILAMIGIIATVAFIIKVCVRKLVLFQILLHHY